MIVTLLTCAARIWSVVCLLLVLLVAVLFGYGAYLDWRNHRRDVRFARARARELFAAPHLDRVEIERLRAVARRQAEAVQR